MVEATPVVLLALEVEATAAVMLDLEVALEVEAMAAERSGGLPTFEF